MAKEAGSWMVLGACVPERAWRLKSWDGFYVPKPFSRVALVVRKPVQVPAEMTKDEMEARRVGLENTLNDCTREAEEVLHQWRAAGRLAIAESAS